MSEPERRNESSEGVSFSTSEIAAPTDDHELPRPTESRRLRVELQILGWLAFGSVLLCGHIAAWYGLALVDATPSAASLGRLWIPQFVALGATSMRLLVDLPAARWNRRNKTQPKRLPLLFLLVGWLMGPLALVLWRRDASARESAPGIAETQAAHARLLRLPYWTALRFLVWSSLACVVSAWWSAVSPVAGEAYDRVLAVSVGMTWTGGAAVIAVALAGAIRAALRPEILSVPTEITAVRSYDVAVRLQLSVAVASIGAVVAIIAGGATLVVCDGIRGGRAAADEAAAAAARTVNPSDLDRLASSDPGLTIEIAGRQIGRPIDLHALPLGPHNTDDDGAFDVWVSRHGDAKVAATIAMPRRALAIPLAGGLAIAALVICAVAWSRNAQSDIERATAQVDAVARGRVPPALATSALATAELRAFVESVDRLVARITESNVEKYVAIEKAKEADRLKSQFLANMSHDLRSPLNAVLGFSELLLSGIDGPLGDEQREMISIIHSSGRELLQQIDDILDTAKLDAGRLEIHPEPSGPLSLVNRAIENARARVHPTIHFEVDAAGTLPPAFVDPYRTVQALENVLVFAAVRMESGTIRVAINHSTSGRRRMIAIEVRTPVAPASATQLGIARRGFHRLPGHRGLGLSLPIAGSIIELSGGTMSIREARDKMVFRIELRALELRRGSEAPRSRSTPHST